MFNILSSVYKDICDVEMYELYKIIWKEVFNILSSI